MYRATNIIFIPDFSHDISIISAAPGGFSRFDIALLFKLDRQNLEDVPLDLRNG